LEAYDESSAAEIFGDPKRTHREWTKPGRGNSAWWRKQGPIVEKAMTSFQWLKSQKESSSGFEFEALDDPGEISIKSRIEPQVGNVGIGSSLKTK
jgi:hypothetical protein